MRLYDRGAAFCKKMRGIISKKSEKRNIRDHKHRLFAAKYELRRNLYKSLFRPHSVYEFFRISCIIFRGLASRGPFMGIKKSSW
ncbi:hypothetical protein AMTRI_Chr11g96830 [Amborella trichopoda]